MDPVSVYAMNIRSDANRNNDDIENERLALLFSIFITFVLRLMIRFGVWNNARLQYCFCEISKPYIDCQMLMSVMFRRWKNSSAFDFLIKELCVNSRMQAIEID